MQRTIALDDHRLAEARLLARRRGNTLTAVSEEALREQVARRAVSAPRQDTVRLPTLTGKGLQSDVDLDHPAALRDRMADLA